MDMKEQDFEVAVWFAGYLAGNLTDEERERLEEWLGESGENRRLFEQVCAGGRFRELNREAARYDKARGWERVETAVAPKRSIGRRYRWMAWVAVGLLLLYIPYAMMRRDADRQEQPVEHRVCVVEPGGAKALLTLADGSVVDLEQAKAFCMREKDGTRLEKDSAFLSYEPAAGDSVAAVPVYNTMSTPRGGEYALKLGDGSIVYLNAMSELRFPVNFVGNIREVELSGEAYFEVKEDALRPFVIRTGDLRIRVLGTEFNVRAYGGEKMVSTTLVEGRVELSARRGKPVVLHPGEQGGFSREAGDIEVKKVNVASCIAWKNGMFDIRDCELEEIMEYLSRWYDIHVFYRQESLKKIRFGCYITRYSDIRPILELLEKTGKIRAQLNGNTVVFSER